ncbi:Protein CBG22037 [Caenorhabditis briggsae]|uniref:Protein CBG22037 n=1 Tax=Caenorhabditis briggsae TaxID=6238 RepID=A8Y1E1_CAEBR|nr:Protein CBG22037 [Caenorhabditis briggsae]CAP38710.2 Protein CBG22037 [Caenorhabditis briggsae]
MREDVLLRFLAIFLFFHPIFCSTALKTCKSFWVSNRPSQDCSSLSLQEPPPLLPNVLSLSVSNNSIFRISNFPPDYRRLQSLRLDQCQLEKLEFEALSVFEQLKELDVSRNSLTKLIIPRNLVSLRVLNLAFNSFSYVPDMSHLESLRLVDLSHNRLISVRPRMLPFNLEVVRLSANRFTHLSPWPFLHKLQELDVTFNDLECDCSLWHFVTWAEKLALFDSTMLPCRRPSELRKSPIDGTTVCGPTVVSSSAESVVVSLEDSHTMCCTALATPPPQLFWQLNGKNISNGLSQKHLSDSGKVEFCLEIRKIQLKDMGKYRCVASLAGLNSSKEFHVERDKIPIVLNSAEGMVIYCQITICAFLGVCCFISCCVLRSGGRGKTRPNREFLHTKVMEIPRDSCEYCCDIGNVEVGDGDEDDDVASRECDDWGDAETAAVRQYLQWRAMHQDQHKYSMIPQIRHESLCRLSNEASLSNRAPLAKFDEHQHSVSFDMTHL